MAEAQNVDISNYYMIGDNPMADIRGGNNNGCRSMLVKTGVWNPINPTDGSVLENDSENPATYVVENLHEAVEVILREENLSEAIKIWLKFWN